MHRPIGSTQDDMGMDYFEYDTTREMSHDYRFWFADAVEEEEVMMIWYEKGENELVVVAPEQVYL